MAPTPRDSPSQSAAPTTAKSGVVPPIAPLTLGPRRRLASKVSSVTEAGKNSPTSANTPAAAAVQPDRSTHGASSQKSRVALGTLTRAPLRGSRYLSPE